MNRCETLQLPGRFEASLLLGTGNPALHLGNLDPSLVLDGRKRCAGMHIRQTCRAVIGPRRKLAAVGAEGYGTDPVLVLDGRKRRAGMRIRQMRCVVTGPRRKLTAIGAEG